MASRGQVFRHVAGLRPRRTVFDLSYRKNFCCDMGQLIPVMCDEVVPGDYFKIGNEAVVRFQPLAAPIMHEITVTTHYFFVPYRLLWDKWEQFISQGQLAGDVPLDPVLPLFDPGTPGQSSYKMLIGTLWDYFGMPCQSSVSSISGTPGAGLGTHVPAMLPIDMPWRAYNLVYNEWYRDQDLQLPVDLLNNTVLNRNWKKDYFTSARPFLQKGQAPALPVVSTYGDLRLFNQAGGNWHVNELGLQAWGSGDVITPRSNGLSATFQRDSSNASQLYWRNMAYPNGGDAVARGDVYSSSQAWPPVLNQSVLGNVGVDLSQVRGESISNPAIPTDVDGSNITFGTSDLRLTVQTQKWLERNARAGTRYTEFLRSHFGVAPSDSRLDRPEYIGGTKAPVIISEVVQTSETNRDTGHQMGSFAGHGLTAEGSFAGKYNIPEYGLIIGLMSVMPKPSYQDGINRQWLRRSPTDFYFPEFAHLSEQAIYQAEIGWTFGRGIRGPGDPDYRTDDMIFGFCGQYDEMRIKHDMVCSDMRRTRDSQNQWSNNLSYWNLSRSFYTSVTWAQDPGIGRLPALNSNFVTCVPRKDVFNVEHIRELIVNFQNIILATRPLPAIAEPGMVDHF